MQIQNLTVPQSEGHKTILYPYYASTNEPKASLVLFHGMAEHHSRYEAFASFLTEHGYDVFLFDHRGHGKDNAIADLGFIAPNHGDVLLIEDGKRVLSYVKEHNRSDRLILMGHSMGSLVARNVLQTFDELDGAIICGTTCPPRIASFLGMLLTSAYQKLKGADYPAGFLDKVLFGGKKYSSLSKETSFDWLTRDHAHVGAYINDPYCGFICSASFYHDLISLAYHAADKKAIAKTRKDLPLFFISGAKDPVGGYGKEITSLVNRFKKLSFTNTSCNLYPECRHELLNELNRAEIMQDILTWLDAALNA